MLLGEDKVRIELQKLDVAWAVVGGTVLNRVYEFGNFNEGLAFINSVASVADELQHHPDVALSYSKVELNVMTHSSGGLTEKDFEFAQSVDKITK